MKRVLITGMSGTGKSAVIRELAARGHRAYDLDTPEFSHWVDAAPSDALTPSEGQDWVWREDRVRELLSMHPTETLFVSGCAENWHKLRDRIDMVLLLSAPLAIVMQRLKERSCDGYGATPEERDKVGALVSAVEPLLRQNADHEIDTLSSVDETVDLILRLT